MQSHTRTSARFTGNVDGHDNDSRCSSLSSLPENPASAPVTGLMRYRDAEARRFRMLAAVLMAATILCGCSEYKSSEFGSYSEARDSGLIERGWIPEFIPQSAYDIRERHRVDAASIDVEFMFNPEDSVAIERACSLEEENIYFCENSGFPVRVVISDGNHAVIQSVEN